MSTYYYLACDSCKRIIPIWASHLFGSCAITSAKKFPDNVQDFLNDHLEHGISVISENDERSHDYLDFTGTKSLKCLSICSKCMNADLLDTFKSNSAIGNGKCSICGEDSEIKNIQNLNFQIKEGCPFCQSTNLATKETGEDYGYHVVTDEEGEFVCFMKLVECGDCGACGPRAETIGEAINKWNIR